MPCIGFAWRHFNILLLFIFVRQSPSPNGTLVRAALIFNESSPEPLPSSADVAETLVTAVTDTNSTLSSDFNLTVIVESISVIRKFLCFKILRYVHVYEFLHTSNVFNNHFSECVCVVYLPRFGGIAIL